MACVRPHGPSFAQTGPHLTSPHRLAPTTTATTTSGLDDKYEEKKRTAVSSSSLSSTLSSARGHEDFRFMSTTSLADDVVDVIDVIDVIDVDICSVLDDVRF